MYDSKHKKIGDKPIVKEKHLQDVVSMSSAFRNYMLKTHEGMDDSERAFKQGNREDLHLTRALKLKKDLK